MTDAEVETAKRLFALGVPIYVTSQLLSVEGKRYRRRRVSKIGSGESGEIAFFVEFKDGTPPWGLHPRYLDLHHDQS